MSMSSYWPTEDGWPYHDEQREEIDYSAAVDDDVLSITEERDLLRHLDPRVRFVQGGADRQAFGSERES